MNHLNAALGYQLVTIDGHRLLVHPVTGRVYPEVSGGSDIPPATPPATPPADPPKAITQAEVDAARAEGARSAANKLAEQLGCSVDEAVAKLADLTAAENAKKDALTKAQEELAAARTSENDAKANAARIQVNAIVREQLILAGAGAHEADPAKRAELITQAARLIDATPDDDPAAVAAKVTETANNFPGLFTPAAGGTPPPPPAGGTPPPGAPPATGAGATGGVAKGAELYQARRKPKTPTAA